MAIIFIIFVTITAILPLRSVLLGGIPFWFDPARDLLLAQANLHKLTLIGPPGGIPGVFYGPYWIWLLSFPMIFFRDPRIITLLAITIPYLILFPLILWKLKKYFGSATIFILWALFITNFESFVTYLWSPYPVALLFLTLSYFVIQKKPVFFIGLVCALIPNFNFSFGVTVVVAASLFQLLSSFRQFPKFLAGVIVVYLPFIFFEFRHNFLQIRSFFDTFLKSAFFNTPVVGQLGMPKNEIIPHLVNVAARILHLPLETFLPIGLVLLIFAVWKGLFKERLVIFLVSCLGTLILIYCLTKNPVWPYYFIGTETIFLLFLGRILSKSKVLTIIFAFVAIFFFISTISGFLESPRPNYLALPTLASKESIARFVIDEAKKTSFAVFAYSPAIYTYDYDYLFNWLKARPDVSAPNAYLIIPPTTEAVRLDFIHYKTPDKIFMTLWEKTMSDGTTVIKRIKTS